MNTELLDYLKSLSKTEFFFVSVADLLFSTIIIICGFISLSTGASMLLYTIMFACATALLGCNSYKCFKRGSKNGWVFAAVGVAFAAITCLCVYGLVRGI